MGPEDSLRILAGFLEGFTTLFESESLSITWDILVGINMQAAL